MKIYLLAICVFISSMIHAQIKKGAIFLGGDISIYGYNANSEASRQDTSKLNNYNFYPSIGWVAKDNLVVGVNLLLSFSNRVDTYYNTKTNRLGAGIFVRKYLPLGKSFYLFANTSLNIQSLNSTFTVQQNYHKKQTGYTINANLIPGISYQLNKSLFLEVALNGLINFGYEKINTEEYNFNSGIYKTNSNNYYLYSNLGNGVPLQVGLRWIIPGK